MADRIYLTVEDVLYLHAELVRLFGGAAGVRDAGLILSALMRPQTGYYSNLIEEGAAMWESLTSHGFVAGNKRMAFAALLVFLGANGTGLTAEPDDIIAFIYRHLEAGTFHKDVLDAWLRDNTAAL